MNAPPGGGLGGSAPSPDAPVGYYTPPAGMGGRPAVILWYRVYALVSLVLYASLAFVYGAFSVRAIVNLSQWPSGVLMASPFILIFGLGTVIPYKPWGWTYGFVMIALGIVGILAPFSVILVILWSRPLVRAAFCRL